MDLNKLQQLGIAKLMDILQEKEFEKRTSEPTLYVKHEGESNILIGVLYVDDLIFTGNFSKY